MRGNGSRPEMPDARATNRADARLLAVIDAAFESAARRAGDWLACRPGCTECCIGPFPITELDARRLRAGLDRLAARDPERAAALLDRAREAAGRMREGFPGDPATGRLGENESAEERFLDRHRALPCPVLDPASGLCELYEFRPVSCRTFGPPVRIGGEDLPPCRLCFRGATAAEIERARMVADPEGLEERALAVLGGDEPETLIPFALAGVAPQAIRR